MKKVFIITLVLIFILVIIWAINLKKPTTPGPAPIPSATPFTPISTPAPNSGAGIETPEYKKAEEEYIKNTPILQKLPAQSSFFSIEYIDEQHLIIHSKTDNKARDYQAAKNWFVENDIDLSKITVEYK